MIKITELPEFSGEFPSGNSVPMDSTGTTYRIELGTAAKKASSFLLDRTNHTGSQSIGTITNLQTTLDTLSSSKANLSGGNTFAGTQVFSDALTFNGTTYNYGTGAATAHKTALSLNNVDNTSDLNKPISTLTQTALDNKLSPVITSIFVKDEFVGAGAGGGVYGELGWQIGGGAVYSFRGWEAGHPGILRMSRAATGTGYFYLSWLSGQGISGFSGLVFETAIRLNSLSGNSVNFGLAGVGALTSAGRKGFLYDPAVSANWLLIHETSAGAMTTSNTGVAAVAGWQILKLSFNGSTTTGTVTTSVGSASTTNSGAATTSSADHSINYSITTTSGTQSIDIDIFQITGLASVTRL